MLIFTVTSRSRYIMGLLRIEKLEYLKKEHNFSMKQKKFLTCPSDGTF